jgi:hypothetical protein
VKARFIALFVLAGCGVDNAFIGGRCAEGFVSNGDACVSNLPPVLAQVIDPGNAPPSPSSDASIDGATVVTGETDAGVSDSSVVDVTVTVTHEEPDAAVQPLVCTDSLVACHGACIPVADDGANCGACGKICPSNICVKGECIGATPGDVVLVGHDFTDAWTGSAQAKVIVNAVSIPTTDPIRVLSYEEGANAPAVAQTKALIHAGIRREVRITRASADDLASPTLSSSYDVVILHDGSSDAPATLGAGWNASLGTFAQKGGVVIAIDGAASRMPELVTATGLLHVDAHTKLASDTHLTVDAPADVVGTQVLSPYAAFGSPVSFAGVTDATTVISASGAPVVLHRVVK